MATVSNSLTITVASITVVMLVIIWRLLLNSFLGIKEFSLAASLRSLNKRANFYSLFLSWILISSSYFEDFLFRLDYPSLSLSIRLWHAWNYNIELCLEAWTRTLTVRLSYDWIYGYESISFLWTFIAVFLFVIEIFFQLTDQVLLWLSKVLLLTLFSIRLCIGSQMRVWSWLFRLLLNLSDNKLK